MKDEKEGKTGKKEEKERFFRIYTCKFKIIVRLIGFIKLNIKIFEGPNINQRGAEEYLLLFSVSHPSHDNFPLVFYNCG